MRQGFFITVEGIDGSGKTTQAKLLKKYLESEGFEVVLTKEPGGTPLGSHIRKILLTQDMNPLSEFLLFASDRAEHVKNLILPSLKQGKVVISDRFSDSSLAYQGYGRGVSIEFINFVHSKVLSGISPDLTVLVDIPPKVGLKRLHNLDRIENGGFDFLKRVRNGYLNMAKQNKRFVVLDGTKDKEYIHMRILDAVKELIRDWRDRYEK